MAEDSDFGDFNRVATATEEEEMLVSEQEQQCSYVLDSAPETAFVQEQQHLAAAAEKERESLDLEAKKQRLLEELESAFLPNAKPKDSIVPNHQDLPPPLAASSGGPSRGLGLGLGFQVIDETALVETLSFPSASAAATVKGIGNGNGKGKGKKGIANAAEAKKDANKQRRKAKKDARNNNNNNMARRNTATTEGPNGKMMIKRRYSRKDMEALRFVNVDQQRNFWDAIFASLQTHIVDEYATLAVPVPVHVSAAVGGGNHPRPPCLPNNKQAPPLLRLEYCQNLDGELQFPESSENGSSIDLSCSQSLISEDGCSYIEGYSEDDDSEDDYASIQRPAFFIDGEPNFDSGPPEDGWEYLRRVRWEADQIPKVKVAKLDRNKLNKEQSPYMPKIPDIAKCPEHLLPLKQWEDVFLAEFSALRANLTCLQVSNATSSSNPQLIHSSQLHGNNFIESDSVKNQEVPLHCNSSASKAIDGALASDDKDTTPVTLEIPVSKICIDRICSNSVTLGPPLLSTILGMDSVARVSMLLKRIRLLEAAATITRNDCMWLFSLCATVDAPLDADTCAAVRNLLRKCASIRAGKDEMDDEVVMLNILATISGKYFGQSEG